MSRNFNSTDVEKLESEGAHFEAKLIEWNKLYAIIDEPTVDTYSRCLLLVFYKFLLTMRQDGSSMIKKYKNTEHNVALCSILEMFHGVGVQIYEDLDNDLYTIEDSCRQIFDTIDKLNELLGKFAKHFHVVPYFLRRSEDRLRFIHPRTKSDWHINLRFVKT